MLAGLERGCGGNLAGLGRRENDAAATAAGSASVIPYTSGAPAPDVKIPEDAQEEKQAG
jgi:hypothetical protein